MYVTTALLDDVTANGPGKTSVLPDRVGSATVVPFSFADPATYVAPAGIVSTSWSTVDDVVDDDASVSV